VEKASIRCQVRVEKMSESKPSDDASLVSKVLSKPGASGTSGISRDDTCLRARRQSVYRRHELNTGFGMERENLASDVKGNDEWQTP
jgi:hypothetical protein